jgi:outer membrane biosynthesis protein TonB
VKKKITGNVGVKVLINEEGLVEKACMVTGNEVFKKVAEKAALKWKFKPGYGFAFTLPEKEGQKRYAFAIIAFVFNRDFE